MEQGGRAWGEMARELSDSIDGGRVASSSDGSTIAFRSSGACMRCLSGESCEGLRERSSM